MTTSEYDYIIVGAGSAGCTLATRLTEDANTRVLLLEAGPWDDGFWLKLPLGWGKVYKERLYDWHYDTEPETYAGNRKMEVARGKVIGGSSSTNAMAYVRGNRGDFDRWSENGAHGWSYKDVLPYFKKQESWEGGESEYRGGSGPLTTRRSRYTDPLVDAYFEAAQAGGLRVQSGLQRRASRTASRACRRRSATAAAAAPRSPICVRRCARKISPSRSNALATRVVFEGTRAIGVEYRQGGETKIARAAKEVLLCGGTINSPQLLMLSGIGAPDELTRARHRGEDGAAGRRQESAGPCRGAGDLWPQWRRPGAAQSAARPPRAGAGAGRAVRHRLHHRPAGRPDRLREDAARRTDLPDAQLLFIAGPLGGRALSAAVQASLRGHLRLPHRGAAAGKPRHHLARLRRSRRRIRISARTCSRPTATGRR